MAIGRTLFFATLLTALAGGMARGAAQSTPQASPPSATQPLTTSASTFPQRYELSPPQRAKAIAYSDARYAIYFTDVALSLLIFFLFWQNRFGVALRDLARRASPRLSLQCLIAVSLLLAAAGLIEFPLDFYSGFIIEHRFGLSTESMGVWLADWTKGFFLTLIAAVFVTWVFYAIVRRSPRRWWFYFWLATIPATLFVIFLEPYVIEPMFYKFTRLEQTQPALTARIEDVLHHARLNIPPAHIFEMDAGAKTTELNAYVSGFGPSLRVVVWDTSIAKFTPDELLLVVGHEVGHYVLHHIVKGFVGGELITFGFFILGFWMIRFSVRRWGERTGMEGEGDLASLPLMMLIVTFLSFLSSPAANALSRHLEHQADQFGLEVSYGIVPDPNAAEARALEVLGEQDLSDPDPSPFIKFWLYSHPPLDERIRFAVSYKPWAQGKPMELLQAPGPNR